MLINYTASLSLKQIQFRSVPFKRINFNNNWQCTYVVLFLDMRSSLSDVQRAGRVEYQFQRNSCHSLPGHLVTIQVQSDIRRWYSDNDFRPFSRQLWHREFRHFFWMRMQVGIGIDQWDILIGTWSILS